MSQDAIQDTSVTDDVEFQALLDEARKGSQEAGWKIVELYGHHIVRVIRRSITKEMRVRCDSADFAQAVWASFFESIADLQVFERPAQLIAYLTSMARHKVLDEFRRRHISKKQGVALEVSFDESIDQASIRRNPRPSEFAIARETWDSMVASQPEHYRRMLQLRYEGRTYDEIAAQTGMASRTVKRAIKKMLWPEL